MAARQGTAAVGPGPHEVAVDGRVRRRGRRNRFSGAGDEDTALTPGCRVRGGHTRATRRRPGRSPSHGIELQFIPVRVPPQAPARRLTHRQLIVAQGRVRPPAFPYRSTSTPSTDAPRRASCRTAARAMRRTREVTSGATDRLETATPVQRPAARDRHAGRRLLPGVREEVAVSVGPGHADPAPRRPACPARRVRVGGVSRLRRPGGASTARASGASPGRRRARRAASASSDPGEA